MKIPIGVSNHHIHVTREVLNKLFGDNYELTVKRSLKQLGQYACEETVTLEHNGKTLEHIRIIGPCRKYTQVELLASDNEYFNINAPVRSSGDLENSETMTIIGPKGKYVAENSTIVSNTHIHFSSVDLKESKREVKDIVSVKLDNNTIINDVVIKSDETCTLELHINKDEAIKLGIENDMECEIC